MADAKNGYHQVQLDKESSKLNTFITEFGRFRYLRSPQSLRSSGDHLVMLTPADLTKSWLTFHTNTKS